MTRPQPMCWPGTCPGCNDEGDTCPSCGTRQTCQTGCPCCGAIHRSACLCTTDVPVVAVCGGRDYPNRGHVWSVLDSLHSLLGQIRVVTGDAAGADHHAHTWALTRGVPALRVRANWDRHGRAAGPIRNQQILDTQYPALVIAFPGGRGTADMCRRARAVGIPVHTTTRPPRSTDR